MKNITYTPGFATDKGNVFGRRLRVIRLRRGWTQDELAKRSRQVQTAISHFERGEAKPSMINFCRLVEALRVSADYLLGFSENGDTALDAKC